MNVDLNTFGKRYLEFYQAFHPGNLPENIAAAGKKCYQILSGEGISFEIFDRICTQIEKDFTELPYSFNLAAYILDVVRDEKEREAPNQANLNKMPINLPREGKPIRLVDNPRLKNALEKIQKNMPELIPVLERINLMRAKMPYNYCYACDNSGFIRFSGFINDYGRVHYKIEENGDNTDYKAVKRCTCTAGQKMSDTIPQATKEESIESAQVNSAYQAEPIEAPF